jgi:tetratricopeptide (TPR) repeat protein
LRLRAALTIGAAFTTAYEATLNRWERRFASTDCMLAFLQGAAGECMDWIRQLADQLRDFLARQPWLENSQATIAATPDLALLAAGPTIVLLVVAGLRFAGLRSREPRRQRGANMTPQGQPEGRRQPAPRYSELNQALSVPGAVPPTLARDTQPDVETGALVRGASADAVDPVPHVVTSQERRASGVPVEIEQERKARVFVSSTFKDMRAEREVLATDTFPSLKRKFRARGVEVQEVDLRWGVNEDDATLDICLQAVRRCNWFVGLIGQRYGTTFEDEKIASQLSGDYPVVREGLGRSVTEIEILEGVLLNTKDDKQTLFFERDPAWLDTLSPGERPDYEDQDADAQSKLAELKTRIRGRVGGVHAYGSPQEIDAVFEQKMSEALEKAFPPVETADDPFMQEHRLHAAYARERLRLYVGGEDNLNQLDAWMTQNGAPPKIAVGASGGGKSTLIAHWTSRWVRTHPNDIVFAHYLGASPDSADPAALIRRLWLHLNRITGDDIAPPSPDTELGDLRDQVSDRLTKAVAFAEREKIVILIALDGLDKLSEENRDLRWWPRVLSPRIKVLASSLDGMARDAARERNWEELVVRPFGAAEQSAFISETLKDWNKSDFPEMRKRRVLGHALAGLPLFLKTILEELRVSAANDVLDARLDDYLNARDMPDLYVRILAQMEHECGKDFVAQALSLIWASRVGLEEDEIVAISSETQSAARGFVGLSWERLRNRLADNLRDSQGRVAFSHDYLRKAVEAIYLKSEDAKRKAHLDIADRFQAREPDARQAEELPYQLRAAEAWERLELLLVDLDRLGLLRARGDGELLSHWLPLKERGQDPEGLLCAAFEARAPVPEHWTQEDIDLSGTLGKFLHFAGATGDASLRLLERRALALERVQGPDHPSTLTALNNFAHKLYLCGDLREAQKLHERVVERMTRVLGAEHPLTLGGMSNLALICRGLGDFDGAQRVQTPVVEAMTRQLGGEHPVTLKSMSVLACILEDRGDRKSAQRLHEFVLESSKRILGVEHPDTLWNMANLAVSLGAGGDLEGARTLQQRVLEARTRLLGAEHVHTLTSMVGLARTLHALGDFEGAKTLHQRALEARKRVLGPEHLDTLSSILNVAHSLQTAGDLEGARTLQQHVLDARTRLLGSEHPDTLTSMLSVARSLQAIGDLEGARSLEQCVLDARTRVLGPEHPMTLSAMNRLALTLNDCGDSDGALGLQERVLEAQTRLLGPEHPDTLTSMHNLAGVLADRGDLERAQSVLERVLDATTRIFGGEHPATLASMNDIAQILNDRGDVDGAKKLQKHILEVRTRLLGAEHPDTLTSMNNLARSLTESDEVSGARQLLERVLETRIRVLGPEHPSTLVSMNNLAGLLVDHDDLEGAQRLQQRAVDASVRVLGADHPKTVTSMSNLAQILDAQGDFEGAQRYHERVLETRERTLGPEHPSTLTSMNNLALTLSARGDLEGALQRAGHVLSVATRRFGSEHPLSKDASSSVAEIRIQMETRSPQ